MATHAKFINSKCLWHVNFINLCHLLITQLICVFLESIFLSRVEGQGFHVEGRGYHVEGNFFSIFFIKKCGVVVVV